MRVNLKPSAPEVMTDLRFVESGVALPTLRTYLDQVVRERLRGPLVSTMARLARHRQTPISSFKLPAKSRL